MKKTLLAMAICLCIGAVLLPGEAWAAPETMDADHINVGGVILGMGPKVNADGEPVDANGNTEDADGNPITEATAAQVNYEYLVNGQAVTADELNGRAWDARYIITTTPHTLVIAGGKNITADYSEDKRDNNPYAAGIYAKGDLIIRLQDGTVTIKGADSITPSSLAGIYVEGDLVIRGDSDSSIIGSLDVVGGDGGNNAASAGIWAESITIELETLTTMGGGSIQGYTLKDSYGMYADTIVINAGEIMATEGGGSTTRAAFSSKPAINYSSAGGGTRYEWGRDGEEWFQYTNTANPLNTNEMKVYIRPSSYPGIPINFGVDEGDNSNTVIVSWEPPLYKGRTGTISSYNIYYGEEEDTLRLHGTADGDDLSYEASGLNEGETYYFCVSAVTSIEGNKTCEGDKTEKLDIIPAGVPDAPVIINTTVIVNEAGEATLEWNAADGNGRDVTKYQLSDDGGNSFRYEIDLKDNTSEDGKYSYKFTGLENGKTYTLQVRAVNPIGEGPASSATARVPLKAPGSVASMSATAGNQQITVEWVPPTNTGGDAKENLHYIVTCRDSDGKVNATYTTGANVLTHTFSGLTNYTPYIVTVRAVNSEGDEGDITQKKDVRPMPTVPKAPKNLAAAAGYSKITLSWHEPDDNGGAPITEYYIYINDTQGKPVAVVPATNSKEYSHTLENLNNGVEYTFYVAAVNEIGEGDPAKISDSPSMHYHAICGVAGEDCTHSSSDHDDVEFREFNKTGGPMTSGNFYLTSDTTLNSTLVIDADDEVNLCLNGFNLKQGSTTGSAIEIYGNGTLYLCSCRGGGALMGGMGRKGEDTQPTAGGGAYLHNNGRMHMFSGVAIKNNTAGRGAGVYLTSGAKFYMEGGTISNNLAAGDGAAGGGVYMESGATFSVNGIPTVSGNSPNNIFLANGARMSVNALSGAAALFVTTETEPEKGAPVSITHEGSDYADFFVSDKGHAVRISGPNIQFALPSVPTAPTNLDSTPGNRQITLTWDPPSDSGGASVSRYEVSRNNGPFRDVGFNEEYTATGLDNGTKYTFRVRAVNSAGEGEVAEVTDTPMFAADGSTSGGLTGDPPAITQDPTSVTVSSGKTGTFNVAVASDTEVRYSWQLKKVGESVWGTIPNTDSSTYTTAVASTANDGDLYRVIATNQHGQAYSYPATLGVLGGSYTSGGTNNNGTGSSTSSTGGNKNNSTSSTSSTSGNKNNSVSIPKTGDASALGYAAAMLQAAGVALALRKRSSRIK